MNYSMDFIIYALMAKGVDRAQVREIGLFLAYSQAERSYYVTMTRLNKKLEAMLETYQQEGSNYSVIEVDDIGSVDE